MCVMDSNNFTKKCRVCGDLAICFNFKGLSCDSCRVFFQRTTPISILLKCKKNGNCIVTKETRKYCKPCRYDKCLAIGMEKAHVDNLATRQLLRRNLPSAIQETQEFQIYDLQRLKAIHHAAKAFPNELEQENIGDTNNLVLILSCEQFYVQRAVKFCRLLEEFVSLKVDDQLSLLKQWYPKFSPVFSAFSYNPSTRKVPTYVNKEGTKVMFFELQSQPEYKNEANIRAFHQFFREINFTLCKDVAVRDLVITMLLFSSAENCSVASNREYLRYNFSLYQKLLLKYLACRFPYTARDKFNAIMRALQRIDRIDRIFKDIFATEVDSEQMPELCVEMLDLM